MIAVALFAAIAIADAQWAAILACPKVTVPQTANGTGVVVGVKDGYAYLLTAAHVVGPFDRVSVEFTSPRVYPKPAWIPDKAEVIARWPDPDLALIRFEIGNRVLPVLPLAPAWQRPKVFPSQAISIGATGNKAATARGDLILGKEFVSRDKKQPAFFWRSGNSPATGSLGRAVARCPRAGHRNCGRGQWRKWLLCPPRRNTGGPEAGWLQLVVPKPLMTFCDGIMTPA